MKSKSIVDLQKIDGITFMIQKLIWPNLEPML